ncbi:MAG: OmpA family protein [Candidatus Cloacimonadaceae bacterium]|nr:OmpA family protein [Candidatus Cloacimonadaceae bacterium]
MKYAFLSFVLLIIMVTLGAIQIGLKGERYALEGMDYYHRGDYKRAIDQFKAADHSANGEVPEYHYWLGRLYIAREDTTNAMSWLARYVQSGDKEFRTSVDDYIEIIRRQAMIFEKVNLRPMPRHFNSRNSDYGAVVDPWGKYLYFTSLRPSRFDKENIWRSEILRSTSGAVIGYGRPELVNELITDGNEAFGSFAADGSGAYIFGNYEQSKLDGDIYYSEYNKKWSPPDNILPLNSSQVDTHPMVYDDSIVFFTSSRDDGFGGTDLYVSEKTGGFWSSPQNLGPRINTSKNEQTPFLDYDGRTLFFASNGHPGFGGYDLFKAVKIGSSWQEWSIPENLGLPMNSIRNDRYFYHNRDSNEGFISTDRTAEGFEKIVQLSFKNTIPSSYVIDDGTGSRISIPMIDEPVPAISLVTPDKITGAIEKPLVPPPFAIWGKVTDDDGNPLSVELEITGIVDGQTHKDIVVSDKEGNFEIKLPYAENYTLIINEDGYFNYTQDFSPPKTGQPFKLDISLKKLEVERPPIIFHNIQFAFDKAVIKESSLPFINEIVVTLLNNPEIKVEISGHTCNIGKAKYNLDLSKRRAKAVVDYLIEKGIEKDRLRSEGFGLSKPLNKNSTIAERALNRRVEVKVIE